MPLSALHLHHHPLDPPSRRVRLALAEKGLECVCVLEKPWEPRPEYLEISPAGDVPTLVVGEGRHQLVLSDATAICEWIEETQDGASLLGEDPAFRAEVRRLVSWFESKTFDEVTAHLVEEKAMKRLRGAGQPDSARIRAGTQNIHGHLAYIGWLTQRRNWLAGDHLTLADLAAAAQISVIDYLGDVPWAKHPEARDWYMRLKSRPSFRPLLGDHIAGLMPAKQYADLDF
ncbi:MAG: glutathione S-transferase family protein [Alphaproteobacteria bacterium]|nr:glutathione S-transferase family protein [Alphaproteobacteria bacterium]